MTHILENWWFPALVLPAFGFSIWRSARRLARHSAAERKNPRHYPRVLHTKAPFRRADFIAKAEVAQKESEKGTKIVLAVLIVAGPLGVAITRLVPHLPRGFFVVYQALFFAAVGVPFVLFTLRGSLLARRSGLICPACGMELEGGAGVRNHAYLIEDRVLETGKCPGCKAQLLDPGEVGPIPRVSTFADTVRGIGLIALLLVVLVVMVYSTRKQLNANAWSHCRRLYAAAYTRSDSLAIDSTRLVRGDRVGCEYFLRTHDPEPDPLSLVR